MQKLISLFIAGLLPAAGLSQDTETALTTPGHHRLEARIDLGFAQAHVLNGRALRDENPNHTFSAGFSPMASTTLRYTPNAGKRLFFTSGLTAWFVNAGPNLRVVGDGFEMDARFRQTTTMLAIPLRAGLHLTRELDVEAGVAVAANLPSRGASVSAGMASWGGSSGGSFAQLETLEMNAAETERAYTSAVADVQVSHAFGKRWFVALRGMMQLGDATTVRSSVSLTTGSPAATPTMYNFSGSPRLAWVSVGAGMRIF